MGYYFHYALLADSKLKAGPFSTIESIYAAPETLHAGEPRGVDQVVATLRDGGADSTANNPGGWFHVSEASTCESSFSGISSRTRRREKRRLVKLRHSAIADTRGNLSGR